MDTITHTLFGLSLYGTIDKREMNKSSKLAYLVTTVGASQIPDIDVISKLWDTEGSYQMWHRGITHSIFLTPIWALLFFLISIFVFKVKNKRIFYIGWLAVFIHNTSDVLNAWGTGYLEPFSRIRITFGTIPIIDLVFWVIIGAAFLLSRKSLHNRPYYFKMAWLFMFIHVIAQSAQGYFLYQQYNQEYDQIALSAGFIPTSFQIITKKHETVTIYQDGILQDRKKIYVLKSQENADLTHLFKRRPEAKTLYEWSPFVVIIDDGKQIGIYDPRFYRNGQSFLYEYITR